MGIDSVNPTGLPFLLNFDYYKSLGLFTQTHEAALSSYLADLQDAKASTSAAAVMVNQKDARLNELWGQADLVLYVVNNTAVTRSILGGDADSSDIPLLDTDSVVVLTSDSKHHTQTGGTFTANVQYAIKFVSPSSALIGGKEVAVEAKQQTVTRLEAEKEREQSAEKRQAIDEQIVALQSEINDLYNGNSSSSGLYALMREAAVTTVARDDANGALISAQNIQEAVEEAFAIAMGDMLRDGYWSDTSYVVGQEELLYLSACEIMTELSKPKVSYTLSVQNLCDISGYEQEVFQPNMAVRIWDEALSLNDHAYVTKLKEFPATPSKDSITISNDVTQIGSTTLDSIISQITGIAEDLNQKKSLYDRSKAISDEGSLPAKRLEGMIDVLKTRLSSSTSNWYTDANGNIVMESLDGKSAMQLCGSGFMIASTKTSTGQWDWRTFGTGEGFTADMIIAGFLSADRIESHSITVNKLASDVGSSLDLSSNTSVNMRVEQINSDIDEVRSAAVAEVLVQYALSSSANIAPATGWQTDAPAWQDGKFMWQRTITTYADGESEVSSATCLTGATGATGADGEAATTLRIESTRGTVFKRDDVSTVLSAVIYNGSQRITDITALRAKFGSTAYLQWKWRRRDDSGYGTISASDSRLSNNGFSLTVTTSDVDANVTFMCELITD